MRKVLESYGAFRTDKKARSAWEFRRSSRVKNSLARP